MNRITIIINRICYRGVPEPKKHLVMEMLPIPCVQILSSTTSSTLPQITPLISPVHNNIIPSKPSIPSASRLTRLDEVIQYIEDSVVAGEQTVILQPELLLATLIELDSRSGLELTKCQIAEHVTHLIRDPHAYWLTAPHCVIIGPSAQDKRIIAKYLGRIWKHLGLIRSEKVAFVSRYNLVSPYVGQTARKAEKFLKKYEMRAIMIEDSNFLNRYNLGYHQSDLEIQAALPEYLDTNPTPIIILDALPDNLTLRRRFQWQFWTEDT